MLHGGHQDAKTLMNTTAPREALKRNSGPSSRSIFSSSGVPFYNAAAGGAGFFVTNGRTIAMRSMIAIGISAPW